jgi:ABC-type proline/glycine betaine transport system permease subunit
MTMEKFLTGGMRTFSILAFGLLAIAVSEVLANSFGYTITRGTYTAGRLLEFAAVFLLFVVTLLLRQIRDQLNRGSGRAS